MINTQELRVRISLEHYSFILLKFISKQTKDITNKDECKIFSKIRLFITKGY